MILLFLCVTVATVATGSFNKKPSYKATAQILVKLGRENFYMPTLPTGDTARPIVSYNRQEQINSEMEIIKGRFLAEKVVETLGAPVIYPNPISPPSLEVAAIWLQKGLLVEAIQNANIITVSFEHEDPQMAARVVNTVLDLYLDRHLQVHKSPQSHEFFLKQYQLLEKRLKQSEEAP